MTASFLAARPGVCDYESCAAQTQGNDCTHRRVVTAFAQFKKVQSLFRLETPWADVFRARLTPVSKRGCRAGVDFRARAETYARGVLARGGDAGKADCSRRHVRCTSMGRLARGHARDKRAARRREARRNGRPCDNLDGSVLSIRAAWSVRRGGACAPGKVRPERTAGRAAGDVLAPLRRAVPKPAHLHPPIRARR